MAAHQTPPSLGFSRQEHWSGLPFPSPMCESEKWSEVAQPCPTVSDPMDFSLPGSSIHGIFQARVLEWVATAFSNMLSRLVITFLPRSKRLLISWLQSPSAVILEPKKIKSDTVSTVSPSISHDVMGPDDSSTVFNTKESSVTVGERS